MPLGSSSSSLHSLRFNLQLEGCTAIPNRPPQFVTEFNCSKEAQFSFGGVVEDLKAAMALWRRSAPCCDNRF